GLLAAAVAIGVLSAHTAHWDLGLLVSLLVLSVASDFLAVTVRGRIRISGSFLALVLAMVFLGGAPAAAIGVATILVGRLRWHEPTQAFLNNLVTYASFPLAGGIGFPPLGGDPNLDPPRGGLH